MTHRRRFLCVLLCCCSIATTSYSQAPTPTTTRFGVSESLPFFDHRLMSDWQEYLQSQLNSPLTVVHRASHHDIFNLLLRAEFEFAWICPAIYRQHQASVTLVAMPLFRGNPNYQMLLVAPTDEATAINAIEDLDDKVIAFAEPDTNFGSNLIDRALSGRDIDPTTFFRRRFYTGDHDRVVRAVAAGLAHSGAITNQTWETLRSEEPAVAAQLRIIWRSGWRPLPPIVAAANTAPKVVAALSQQLQQMHTNPAGQRILERLHFDRFVAGNASLFLDDPAASANGGDKFLGCGP